MDSGNSGSLQSSSGGDDEFDSRCGGGSGGGVDSLPLSALLRQSAPASPSVANFGGSFYGLQELASPPLPPLSQAAHQWSAALPTGGGASPSSSSHGMPASADQLTPAQPAVAPPPRGSRKRTRASRRAPTTVLTTDTSNFRAMVQEFTGIPSPPFAGGAPTRSRFDHLFPSPSSLRSAAAGATHTSLPPYLLRPFAQKLRPSPFPPFASPSTSSPAPSNISITPSIVASASASPSTTAVASGDTYHQLASAPPPALLGMQDHSVNYLSIESPLGAQLGGDAKYPSHPLFDAAGRSIAPSAPRLQDPADFLGLTHGIMGSEGTHLHPRNRDHDHGHGADELSGLVGAHFGSVPGSPGGFKTTYSSGAGSGRATPLLERNVENTSAGVAVTTTTTAVAAMRTQGVDSWICTSE